MKILVTGGTGVIGGGLLPALLRAGHGVRLLTRGAEEDAREWPEEVEPFAADVSDAKSLKGAAKGCEVVVHITGIIKESPPKVTFERVNVAGAKNVLKEAESAGVRRFIFVSSLGADRGASAYHRSKLKAEGLVEKFKGEWLILRPGLVYGPGDEVASVLLKMVRALPAVPIIGDGEQRFQPVWHEDFGEVVARAVEEEISGETLEVAGDEITTTRDLIERLARITNRNPSLVPVPSFVATLGVRALEALSLDRVAADALNLDVSLDEAKVTMLLEENFIREPNANALTEVFGVEPTPLDAGLEALANSIPEQLPSSGFGPLRRKSFWADIEKSRHTPSSLVKLFRERCAEVMPIEFGSEPNASNRVEKDSVLTASLPARGNIQMKVAEAGRSRVTFITIEGHPLAGLVSFTAEKNGRALRFAVDLYARSANALDFLAMNSIGSVLQDENWIEVVGGMVELSGGRAPEGVFNDAETLEDDEAAEIESWAESLTLESRRARNESATQGKRGAGKSGKSVAGLKAKSGGKATKAKTKRDAPRKSETRPRKSATTKPKSAASSKSGAKRNASKKPLRKGRKNP